MASVRQLKEPNREGKRPWVVEYTDAAGKRRRATPSTGLKKDAEQLRQKIERELHDDTHVAKADTMTVREGMEIWLKDCDRRHHIGDMSGNCLTSYRYYARHWMPAIGRILVARLTAEHLQARLDELAMTYSDATLKGARRMMKTFLFHMQRIKVVKRHILVDAKLNVPKRKNTKPKMPTKHEIVAILRAVERLGPTEHHQGFHTRRVVVLLAMFCGLRRGEIAGLQWENVDLANRVVRIRHSYSRYDGLKDPKSEAGNRDVPMPQIVCDALATLLGFMQLTLQFKEDPRNDMYKKRIYRDRFISPPPYDPAFTPHGFVITTRDGKPASLENMSNDFIGHVVRKAGLPAEARARIGLHSLRHAFVSLLVENGTPIANLTKLVGHSSVAVTHSIYTHMFADDDGDRLAIERAVMQFDATKTRFMELNH